ncbi:hypothetical protein [Vibrio aestuarianus]|uniref:Uncharacterized protein n=3 Tax=Vibrio aestuarianus TaxID=28171 RepID=A0A9X4IQ77_9VIBR|nr:hypothetical protein [Vibrio aestuarianus]MDE1242711.1 hypothetical protein [Vibrio aestuarianus]
MLMPSVNRLGLVLAIGISLAACGGGEGDSSSNVVTTPKSVTPPTSIPSLESEKDRLDIVVNDITLLSSSSYAGYSFSPTVFNQMGEVSYTSDPADIVVDNGDGSLMVLKPGSVTVTATDTLNGYKTAKDIFNVTIEKWDNSSLKADSLTLNTLGDNNTRKLNVRGFKGELNFTVQPKYDHIISVDHEGNVTANGLAGTAIVTITDSGNSSYKSTSVIAKIIVTAVSADTLSYENFEQEYSDGLFIQANKITGAPIKSQNYFVWDGQDVLNINPATGEMEILKAGEAIIQANVEYQPGHSTSRESATFTVKINKAEAPYSLKLDKQSVVFEEEKRLQPSFNGSPESVSYSIADGQDVLSIDPSTHFPQINNTGTIDVTVTVPENDRYKKYQGVISYNVIKAPHPGLRNDFIKSEYHEDLSLPFHLVGQKGNLSIISSELSGITLRDEQLKIPSVGYYVLSISDDGGRNYQPAANNATVIVDISQGVQPQLEELKPITVVYDNDLLIDLSKYYRTTTNSDLEIINISNKEVVTTVDASILKVINSGTTVVTVRKPESSNFKASNIRDIVITVQPVKSSLTLSPQSVVSASLDQKSLPAPVIIGANGQLSYSLNSNSAIDVIKVNKDGSMDILNAGVAIVRVVDSGRGGFSESEMTFNVMVAQADNPIKFSYPSIEYQDNLTLSPNISQPIGSNEIITTNYKLLSSNNNNVEVNKSTGELTVKGAGDYNIEVTSSSRNYKESTQIINGSVKKATHPGIVIDNISVDFSPFKKIKPVVSSAQYGKRIYMISTESPSISVDVNSGEISLNDYDSGAGHFNIFVYEEESDNYFASEKKHFIVQVNSPQETDANQVFSPYYTINQNILTLKSDLGIKNKLGVGTTYNLEGSRFSVLGHQALERNQLVKVSMESKITGEQGAAIFRLVRSDSCISEDKIINWNEISSCEGEGLSYNVTLTLIDASDNIKAGGVWLSTGPIIIARYGDRKFYSGPDGGGYSNTGVFGKGYSEPSNLYWWELVNITLDGGDWITSL